jgi:hypothetical protein
MFRNGSANAFGRTRDDRYFSRQFFSVVAHTMGLSV